MSTIAGNDVAGVYFNEGYTRGVTLYTAAARDKGEVVMITYDETENYEMVATDPATTAFPIRTAVAAEDIAATSVGRFYIEGKCQALCNGTTDIAAGDYLEVLNTADNFVKDGVRSDDSAAVALEAYTDSDDALKSVYLINEQHIIAGS